MSAFSARSLANLKGVHPVLVELMSKVTMLFDCSILPGSVRTKAQQALNVKNGLSQTMNSMHIPQRDGYSHAVDAACNPQQWDNSPRSSLTKYEVELIFFGGFVQGFAAASPEIMKGYTVRYGGDWNTNNQTQDNTFNDLDHFELRPKA
jgi:peptidoglycan L-alanyl-D-glutamate endopeptidase CwlK